MATSGDMTTGESAGRSIRFHWWQTGQSTSGNYTDISWQLIGDGSYTGTNGQGYVMCGPYDLWISGTQYYKNSRDAVKKGDVVHSGTHRIYHNSSGDGSFVAAMSAAVYSTGLNVSTGDHTWSLNKINRYANFTAHNINSTTEHTIKVNWNADVSCDAIQYKLGSGSWVGTSGHPIYTISGLNPGTTYSIKSRIKRQDSQLWTESGSISGTTKDCVVRNKINGTWKSCVPYIKINGTWKKAIPYINVNGTWKEGIN